GIAVCRELAVHDAGGGDEGFRLVSGGICRASVGGRGRRPGGKVSRQIQSCRPNHIARGDVADSSEGAAWQNGARGVEFRQWSERGNRDDGTAGGPQETGGGGHRNWAAATRTTYKREPGAGG